MERFAVNSSKIKVLIAKPGLDGHDRGAVAIAHGLMDAGMEVVYLGLRTTPDEIAAAAMQEDVHVVGLSCLSGAHMTLFSRTAELIRQQTDRNILMIGGGIIPRKDVPALKAAGIAETFGPGTPIPEIVKFIESHVEQ
jgi:methylmalonyl-CoA mutase C-terminal domain/subunit